MSVKWKDPKTGKEKILLNYTEKIKKAKAELKSGYHGTNDKRKKTDKDGNFIPLTATQKAYRAGMIAADTESKNIYHYNKAKAEGHLDEWKNKKVKWREEHKSRKS